MPPFWRAFPPLLFVSRARARSHAHKALGVSKVGAFYGLRSALAAGNAGVAAFWLGGVGSRLGFAV